MFLNERAERDRERERADFSAIDCLLFRGFCLIGFPLVFLENCIVILWLSLGIIPITKRKYNQPNGHPFLRENC